jgi:thioredoxin
MRRILFSITLTLASFLVFAQNAKIKEVNLPVAIDPDAKPDTKNKMEYEELARFIESGKTVFVDFYAPWCGPCRTMMPIVDELKTKYHKQITVIKVNVDTSKKLVKEMKIQGVPYLALYKNGELVYSKNGAVTRNELSMPLRDGLSFAVDILRGYNLKKEIKVIASGKVPGLGYITASVSYFSNPIPPDILKRQILPKDNPYIRSRS